MFKNDLLRVLDEADNKVSECIDNFKMKSGNEHEESVLHQTNGSLLKSTNTGGSFIYDKPLRPLSAYNIYFQLKRERILKYGNTNHKEYETIPFTIQDMERVVRERYENWAGIARSATASDIASSSNKRNKNVRIPSFGELSREIGLSWKKLDNETKNRIELFACKQTMEYNKIHGITTKKRRNSIRRESIPSTLPAPTQQKISCSSLNEVSPIMERSIHNLVPQNSLMNNNSKQLWQKNPNLNMMMTLNHNDRQMHLLQQRNSSMVQQHQFHMWQQYQAIIERQYDLMMTSMMIDSQNSQYCMTEENDDDDNDEEDDDDPIIDALDEQYENYNNMNNNYSLPPDTWDDIDCFGDESIVDDSVKINYSNHHALLPNVSHHSSLPLEQYDEDDETFHESVWDF